MKKGGLISFSDVSTSPARAGVASHGSRGSGEGTLASPVYSSGEATLFQISKRLQKKDGVTRYKALIDLVEELRGFGDAPDASVSIGFLPFYLHTFERMWVVNDRRIREELFKALYLLIENIGKADSKKQALAPYMKALIGPWWISLSDPCTEVANAAERAFSVAIPPKKVPSVLEFLSSSILARIYFVFDSVAPSSGSEDEKVEAEETYIRLHKSAGAALERLLNNLSFKGLLTIAKGVSVPPAGILNVPKVEINAKKHKGDASIISLSDLLSHKILSQKLKDPLLKTYTLDLLAGVLELVHAKKRGGEDIARRTTKPETSTESEHEQGTEEALLSALEAGMDCKFMVAGCFSIALAAMKRMLKERTTKKAKAAGGPAVAEGGALFKEAAAAIRALIGVLRYFPSSWQHLSFAEASKGTTEPCFMALLEATRLASQPLLQMFLLPLVAVCPISTLFSGTLYTEDNSAALEDGGQLLAWLANVVEGEGDGDGDGDGEGDGVQAGTLVAVTETLTFLLLRGGGGGGASHSEGESERGEAHGLDVARLLRRALSKAIASLAAAPPPSTLTPQGAEAGAGPGQRRGRLDVDAETAYLPSCSPPSVECCPSCMAHTLLHL